MNEFFVSHGFRQECYGPGVVGWDKRTKTHQLTITGIDGCKLQLPDETGFTIAVYSLDDDFLGSVVIQLPNALNVLEKILPVLEGE